MQLALEGCRSRNRRDPKPRIGRRSRVVRRDGRIAGRPAADRTLTWSPARLHVLLSVARGARRDYTAARLRVHGSCVTRYRARVQPAVEGGWIAVALELPHCWSRAADREQALARLRDEIRYRIEYCPCTGVADDFVQLEVVDDLESRSGDGVVPVPSGWKSSPRGDAARFAGVAGCPGPRPESGVITPTSDAETPGWKRWDDPSPRTGRPA